MSTNLFRPAGWSAYLSAAAILCGPNHLLTYIGGALSVIAYPVWGFWLGRLFLKSN